MQEAYLALLEGWLPFLVSELSQAATTLLLYRPGEPEPGCCCYTGQPSQDG